MLALVIGLFISSCTTRQTAPHPQKLSLNPEVLGVVRLDAGATIPDWAIQAKGFTSITRTAEELSIVCLEGQIPKEAKKEMGYQAFKVEGPLDFALTGILASIATPLAQAGISIFAVSTFDTDYILVKKDKAAQATSVLRTAGHTVSAPGI